MNVGFKVIAIGLLILVGYLLTSIDLNKLLQGCPVKDCIPAIDNPKFISAKDAERLNQIEEEDVVFAVFHKGVAKAYPQRILNWHEIVNDSIASDPILITFCPLCGTAIGFERSALYK